MKSPRFAMLLGALSLSLLISGCGPGRLHILIPDFVAKGVDGIRLFRVAAGGGLQAAGRIEFRGLSSSAGKLEMRYAQLVPGRAPWGPLVASAKRPATGQLELELAFYNPGPAAFFRFATYNEKGTSRPSASKLYVGAAASQ
jgi:hypothetical protein